MRNKILNLLLFTGIISFANADAASIVTITALQSPVWLQQDGRATELSLSSVLTIGDNVAAGDTGRVEMRLWENAILQLNSNSEIAIKADGNSNISTPGVEPELYFQQGRGCIDYTARSRGESKFKVNLGNTMFVAIHLHGDVCVLRQKGLSAIKLRAGSVEITHSVGQDMIILSEAGTEFRIEDNGTYEISFPGGDELSVLEIEKPFIIEPAMEDGAAGNSPEPVESDNAATDELIAPELVKTVQETQSIHVYTVYLFSTRSKEVADQVNQKFQDAGHDTQIYETTSDSGSRYRIAVTGFESRQAAENYSDSIVGKLGVTGTWVGKELRIEDNDSSENSFLEDGGLSPTKIVKPFIFEEAIDEGAKSNAPDIVESGNAVTDELMAAEPVKTVQETQSTHVYTVYLFSTRSEVVAEEVNQKFQNAGHDTQIYETTSDSGSRYRIVVTGFESRQAANEFSDSVVGKLGVTGTWIGKENR